MKIRFPLLALLFLFPLGACDTVDVPASEPEYVVEGYLQAGRPLDRIRLSVTAPVNTEYDFSVYAVSKADVTVHLLDGAGGVEKSYRYAEGEPGVYYPSSEDRVRPRRTYRLEITVPEGGPTLTASTTVPEALEVVEVNADRVVYQSNEQLEVTLSRNASADRQSVYILSARSLDPRVENLTPTARYFFQEEGLSLEQINNGSSPPVNEANFDQTGETVRIRVPWFAINFFGTNRFSVSTLDLNLYDFIRSQNVQQGGALAPGEIPNVLDHVEGGTGIFGSFARASVDVFVVRPGT